MTAPSDLDLDALHATLGPGPLHLKVVGVRSGGIVKGYVIFHPSEIFV